VQCAALYLHYITGLKTSYIIPACRKLGGAAGEGERERESAREIKEGPVYLAVIEAPRALFVFM
jgi:hypothetical protein